MPPRPGRCGIGSRDRHARSGPSLATWRSPRPRIRPVPATASSSFISIAEPHLAARGLACRRGGRLLFERLDVALQPGELVWLRGRNGRGKTSLMRVLAGLATPEHGEVLLDGTPIVSNDLRSRRVVYVGHTNALKDDLSAAEALAFLLCLHGRADDRTSVDAALDAWGMLGQRDSFVRNLSQGQRRRVALARLAAEREATLWLLDEPFDALDSAGIERLNTLLAQHLQRGGAVLLTGHQAALAPSLHHRELDLDGLVAA